MNYAISIILVLTALQHRATTDAFQIHINTQSIPIPEKWRRKKHLTTVSATREDASTSSSTNGLHYPEVVLLLEKGRILPRSYDRSTCHDFLNIRVQSFKHQGYSNQVFRVDVFPKDDKTKDKRQRYESFVVKLFSPLTKVRLEDHLLGAVDILASQLEISPKVYFSGADGVVMKFIHGKVLSETDIQNHWNGTDVLCQSIAAKLAHLHSAKIPKTSPEMPLILWHTMHKMMDFISASPRPIPESLTSQGWTFDKLSREVEMTQETIESLNLPIVLGHGDFKPSNVIIEDSSHSLHQNEPSLSRVHFLDFELSGPNYRGYDICKLFRSLIISNQNPKDLELFVKSYLSNSNAITKGCGRDSITQLVSEAKLFEPLTWLEAGIFFLFANHYYNGSQGQLWESLACDRLKNYIHAKRKWERNADVVG